MRWAKTYRRHNTLKQSIMKKKERRDKMARLKTEKKSKTVEPARPSILPEQYFVLCNGTQLKNIRELAVSMDHLDEKEFSFHVNENKNDFANWVRDVFKEQELADDLARASDMKHTHIALLKHVAFKK